MCNVLKEKATMLPKHKFLGVNIHSLANHPQETIDHTLEYLSGELGLSMIRIWATPDRGAPEATKKVLDSAHVHNLKAILVLADYSNSSGDILPGPIRDPNNIGYPTNWYQSEYQDNYLPYVQGVVSALKAYPAIYGYELANEAHCSGVAACKTPYYRWANRMAREIKKIDPHRKVGIGQKANENSTLGDSPDKYQFMRSNNSSYVDMTSGHYYDLSTKTLVLQAKKQARRIGKSFYIGEAGFLTNG